MNARPWPAPLPPPTAGPGSTDAAATPGTAPPRDPIRAGPALWLGLIASLVLLAGFGGWAVFAAIEGAILAQGQVAATRTRLVLQHPEGGRIADLHVADGQSVAAGQLVARLDAGLIAAERAIVESQFLEALARSARHAAERDDLPDLPDPLASPDTPALAALAADAHLRAGLAAPLEGQRRLHLARRETLERQIAQLSRRRAQVIAQRAGLEAQTAALIAEAALITADLDQQAELVSRGLAPAARLAALSREQVRSAGMLAATEAERAALDGRMTEIEMQILGLQASHREEAEAALRDLGVALIELAMRRQVLDERLSRLDIRAPVSGRIHALAAGAPGAVLRPAEPLAELVPIAGDELVVLQIRPEDIDRVRPGQPVRLLLPSGGGRDRAEIDGAIVQLSPDAVEDPRTGLRHIRAEVAPDPASLAALGIQTLPPGLPVEGQIRTGSRSPLAWLMAPVLAQFDRALRVD